MVASCKTTVHAQQMYGLPEYGPKFCFKNVELNDFEIFEFKQKNPRKLCFYRKMEKMAA